MKQVKKLLKKLNKKLDRIKRDRPKCSINFDLKSSIAVGCYYPLTKEISVNGYLFKMAGFKKMKTTIIHEFSHYAVDVIYGNSVPSHGKEWKNMMRYFGVSDPKAKNQTLYMFPLKPSDVKASCNCGDFFLSIRRANKIKKGTTTYKCRTCLGKIKLKKKND